MPSLRDTIIEVIKGLPEDSSLKEIIYAVNLTDQVLEGLEDEAGGRTVTTKEVLAELAQWRQK